MKKGAPILTTQNLDIGYRSKRQVTTIAKGLNIEIETNQLIAVLGKNGVGKSTFLEPYWACNLGFQEQLLSMVNYFLTTVPQRLPKTLQWF